MSSKDSSRSGPAIDGLGNAAGIVVTGFVAVLNFIGLTGAEVGNVFRSESPVVASFVYLLLAASLLVAVASIAISRDRRLFKSECWTLALVLSVLGLVVNERTIPPPIPRVSRSASTLDIALANAGKILVSGLMVIIFSAALLAVAIFALVDRLSKKSRGSVSAKTALVLLATALAITSAYAGVRIEENSQLNSSYPQISAQFKPAQPGTAPTFDVSATSSRLPYSSRVDLRIYGVRKGFDVLGQCLTATSTVGYASPAPCFVAPCNYFAFTSLRRCDELVVAALQPNDAGAVAPRNFTVQVDSQNFQQVEVFAQICTSPSYGVECSPGSAPKFGFANLQLPS